jgi:hypothetical protein
VSASAYYRRRTAVRSARRVEDERLLERIREIHAANYYAYGSRRMWKALQRAGESVGRGHVERLMRAYGIQAPSAAASLGRPPRRIGSPGAGPTWSIATSAPRVLTSSGSLI